VCGDSHEPTSYQYLLEGKPADLVLTDPLFNIAIDGSCSDREADVATASGEMSEAQFIASLTAVLQHSKENTKDGAILFVFMDWRHLYELITASREVGLALKDIVVWAKGDAEGAAKGNVYRCRHELVLVFKKATHLTPTPSSRVSTAGPTSGTMRRSAVCRRPRMLPCIAHGGRRRSWPMRFWT
jgi:hypothetical protein